MNKLSLNKLAFELNSISLDWKSIRNQSHCTCSSTFDFLNKKINCCKCGEIFCNRCIKSFSTHVGFVSLCVNCQKIVKEIPNSYINLDSISHTNSIEQSLYTSGTNIQHSNSINNSDHNI